LDLHFPHQDPEIRQFTGLVNAFTRLKFKNEEFQDLDEGNGDPNYYDQIILGSETKIA
jgi:hypothetical protein